MSENRIRGEVPIFKSPIIKIVNLSRNQLTGRIPNDIGDTGGKGGRGNTPLQVFDLKYNRLSGTIPESIGDISTNLMKLDLSHNKLVGKCCNWQQLQIFPKTRLISFRQKCRWHIFYLFLSGTIPETLGSLLKMESLSLSHNKLHGSIPAQLLRSDMEQLKQIFIMGNLLSGTVPPSLADLPNIKNLLIGDNKFTGTIPSKLCDLNLNEVYFQPKNQTPFHLESGRTGCNSIACPAGYRSLEASIFLLDVDLFFVHSSKYF